MAIDENQAFVYLNDNGFQNFEAISGTWQRRNAGRQILMKITPASQTKTDLRELYQMNFRPRAWIDASDPGYICITLIERSIALLAPNLEGELIDVGSGQQPYAGYFAHVKRKWSCDYDAQRGNVDFECPADAVPMPDSSLDSVLCTEVLEHVPDPLAVWREFNRLLRPGGKVLLATPMYWPGHEEPYDFYRYPEFGLRRLVQESGFELVRIIPRGGVWAFFGQVVMHVFPPLLPFRWQRRMLNKTFLRLDQRSCNPRLTLGWTVLARKISDSRQMA
jgi:SAM-dependent methyltransferase